MDTTQGQSGFLWTNDAALKWLYCRPSERMAEIQPDKMSEAIGENWRAIYNKVQVEHGTHKDVKTSYFVGKPLTFKLFCRPIRMIVPGEEEERTLVLTSCTPVDHASFDENQVHWRLPCVAPGY